MPEKRDEKTESAPKLTTRATHRMWWVVLALLVVGSLWALLVVKFKQQACTQITSSYCLRLERVSSPEDLQRGLSGRQSLAQDRGMLFVFDAASKHCFWMKDMHFPLDMIWLDDTKTVVHVEKNVAPDTYPNSFCPDKSAQYVLEVNAGVTDTARITRGSQLQF